MTFVAKKSDVIANFLRANLFMFIPPLAIIIFYLIITIIFGSTLDFLTNRNSVCDGSSSFNICQDVITLMLSTIFSFIITEILLKHLKINWKSPLYGIGLFYGIPIALFIMATLLTNGIYGNDRGAINHGVIGGGAAITILSLGFICFKNYQAYQKTKN